MTTLSRRAFLTGAALVGAGALVVPELWTPSRTFFLPPLGGWFSHGINYAYPRGDVRRYGAIADGITDCTAAFNAAFEDMARVHVPAGEWRVDGGVHMPKDRVARLIGAGKYKTRIVNRVPDSAALYMSENHAASNLTVVGTGERSNGIMYLGEVSTVPATP